MNGNVSGGPAGLRASALVPPPVPTSRGPSLPNGARAAGGPPRSTPKRYATVFGVRLQEFLWRQRSGAANDDRHRHALSAPGVAAAGERRVWRGEGAVPASPSSAVPHAAVEASAPREESLATGNGSSTDLGDRHTQALPPPHTNGAARRNADSRESTPLPHAWGAHPSMRTSPDTVASAPSRFPPSGRQDVFNNAQGYSDEDEDSLPSAMPPPKPYPATRPTTWLEHGETATKVKANGGSQFDNSLSLQCRNETRTIRDTKGERGRSSEYDTPTAAAECPLATPVMSLPVCTLLTEVHAWSGARKGSLDVTWCQEFLRETGKIISDLRGEIETLQAENAAADEQLRDAKARQVASLDGHPLKEGVDGQKLAPRATDEEENPDEFSEEMEAWRIEKGELLAEKALLLQKRKELQYHLRRGTNIKNVSGLMISKNSSPTRHRGSDGNDSDSDAAPCASNLQAVQLRLEVKAAEVQLARLAQVLQSAEKAQRARRKEANNDVAALRQALAAARQETDDRCGVLRAALEGAERLRECCGDAGRQADAVLLEQAIGEAQAALKGDRNRRSNGRSCKRMSASV